MTKRFYLIAYGIALAIWILGWIAAAHAGTTIDTRCTWGHCRTTIGPTYNGPDVHVLPPMSAEQEAAVKVWEAFCKPVGTLDKYGVTRLSYAHEGCEFGRHE